MISTLRARDFQLVNQCWSQLSPFINANHNVSNMLAFQQKFSQQKILLQSLIIVKIEQSANDLTIIREKRYQVIFQNLKIFKYQSKLSLRNLLKPMQRQDFVQKKSLYLQKNQVFKNNMMKSCQLRTNRKSHLGLKEKGVQNIGHGTKNSHFKTALRNYNSFQGQDLFQKKQCIMQYLINRLSYKQCLVFQD